MHPRIIAAQVSPTQEAVLRPNVSRAQSWLARHGCHRSRDSVAASETPLSSIPDEVSTKCSCVATLPHIMRHVFARGLHTGVARQNHDLVIERTRRRIRVGPLSSPPPALSECHRHRHIAGAKNSAAKTSIASQWPMAPCAKQARASRSPPVSCCLTRTTGCVSHTTCVSIGAMPKKQRQTGIVKCNLAPTARSAYTCRLSHSDRLSDQRTSSLRSDSTLDIST